MNQTVMSYRAGNFLQEEDPLGREAETGRRGFWGGVLERREGESDSSGAGGVGTGTWPGQWHFLRFVVYYKVKIMPE